jgi:hypothetical protein
MLTVSVPGLELGDEQRVALETMARSSSLPHRAVVQARGLLLAADVPGTEPPVATERRLWLPSRRRRRPRTCARNARVAVTDASLKCRSRPAPRSTAGHEGHDDVGRVAVEVLPSAVVDGGRARVGVSGGELDIAKRNTRVESRHDERGPEHVRMHLSQASPPTDRPDPPVRGAPVEALPVSTAQDRSLEALADGKVDGSRRAGHERNGRGLGALAQDAQRSVAPLTAQVLDVGGARFADPQPVKAEEHSECRVVAVVLLGGEQDTPSSERSRPRASEGWTRGRRTYWAGFDEIRPSMCANR